MVTDTLAPMGAASFFIEKPLDCARGDKKDTADSGKQLLNSTSFSVTLYFISLHHANRHYYHITRTNAKPI